MKSESSKQSVARPHSKESCRKSLKVGAERRDVRIPQVRRSGEIRIRELPQVDRAQHQSFVTELLLARRHGKIVPAVDQVRGAKAGEAVTVAHAQQRDGGEGCARRFAADSDRVGTEFGFGVFREPQRGRFAVVRRRGVRILRREAVFDAYTREARFSFTRSSIGSCRSAAPSTIPPPCM